ncbi:GDP-L-galactose phosphorylase 2 [Nymphaea thermarum]|nr:GDP-L-galactose phosphorylase 2 [Nymphaea thermarum]
MLTIKRVPTVVSNYQEDSEDVAGCGRKCLGKCCLPVSKLPLYAFKPRENNTAGNKNERTISDTEFSFNPLLLGQWEERMSRGLFRYDVTACETKVIPGQYGFIAQLNEGRHLKKRPTEFRVDKVLQPFDANKFNFTKVGQEEVLFRFEENCDEDQDEGNDSRTRFFPKSSVLPSAKPSVVAINAYYLNVPFPVEKAPARLVAEKIKNGVKIYELCDYPVRGLVFEGGKNLSDLSDEVSTCCIWLQNNNIPYNLLISDSGKRIFLFPQCYAEKQALGEVSQELLDTQVNPAVWEISGHMVLKRKKDYEDASEDYAWKLLAVVSLSEERFEEVKAYLLEAVDGFILALEPKKGHTAKDLDDVIAAATPAEKEDLFQVHGTHAHVHEGCLVLQ